MRGHFFHDPFQAPSFFKLINQARIKIAQMCDISNRIIELLFGKGAARPICKTCALIKIHVQSPFDERHISNAVTKPERHGGNLRIKNWLWYSLT